MAFLFRLSSLILLAFPVVAPAAEAGLTAEERTLREAGVAIDGPSLLAFLKAQTPSADEQARLASAVTQLGHRSYGVREKATQALVAAGRPALALVRVAHASPDLEISRRAARVIEEIERISYTSLLSAAVRVLSERRPAGTVEALLAYLSFVPDDQVEEAVREALLVVGLDRGQPSPLLRAALSDREPRRRAAAVFVLGRLSPPPLKEIAPLLHDPVADVRYAAAEATLRGKSSTGVPVLVALLEAPSLALARRAEELLFQVAGDASPSASLGGGEAAARRRCQEAWRGWWTSRGEKIDLSGFLSPTTVQGLTLYCVYDSPSSAGRVWLTGPDGKTRWEISQLQGPNDAHLLPGGRVLIAERNNGRVTERDSQGRILWEKRVEAGALSAVRMPGGNTLIASWTSVLEAAPDGKTLWEYTHPGGFRHVTRTPKNTILAVTAAGQILELDRGGKLLRSITPERHGSGAGYWASVEPLANGRFLLALGSSRRVVEIDTTGKILSETEIPNAVFATRLRNGHTLVCSFEECQAVELDRGGKEVSRQRLPGRPFAARRY